MATVKGVRAILEGSSGPEITRARHTRDSAVHVEGFVTTTDLRILVRLYKVFMHSDGVLCVE